MSQLYSRTREWKKSSRVIYIFKIIQSLNEKVTERDVALVMILFDNLLNNFSSIGKVEILYFSINIEHPLLSL